MSSFSIQRKLKKFYCSKSESPKDVLKDDKIDRRVYPIAASTLMMGTAIGVIIPVMPLFFDSLGFTGTEFGFVVASMGFTRILVNIPLATMADVFGRRPLLIWGPIGTACCMLGTGLSTTLSELVAFRMGTGMASSGQITGAQLYLTDISNRRNRARTLAPMVAAWSTGAAIGPAIGGVLADQYGISAPFFFVSFAILMVSVSNYYLVTETKPRELEVEGGMSVSKRILYSFSSAFSQWRELLKNREVFSVVTLHMALWVLLSGFQFTSLPMFAATELGLSSGSLGIIYTVIAVINVAGSQPAAYLADKVGRKAAILPGMLIIAMSVLLIPWTTEYNELLAMVVLLGTGTTLVGTAPTAYLTDRTTHQTRSQALALLRSAGDVGLVIGAASTGLISTYMGFTFSSSLNAAILLSATLIFLYRTRKVINQN